MAAYVVVWLSAVHLLMLKVPVVLAGDVDLDVRMMALELSVHLVPLCYVPIVWLQSRQISKNTATFMKIKVRGLQVGDDG